MIDKASFELLTKTTIQPTVMIMRLSVRIIDSLRRSSPHLDWRLLLHDKDLVALRSVLNKNMNHAAVVESKKTIRRGRQAMSPFFAHRPIQEGLSLSRSNR